MNSFIYSLSSTTDDVEVSTGNKLKSTVRAKADGLMVNEKKNLMVVKWGTWTNELICRVHTYYIRPMSTFSYRLFCACLRAYVSLSMCI